MNIQDYIEKRLLDQIRWYGSDREEKGDKNESGEEGYTRRQKESHEEGGTTTLTQQESSTLHVDTVRHLFGSGLPSLFPLIGAARPPAPLPIRAGIQ